MDDQYVDAVDWARNVSPDEPHGLRDLEDVVLSRHPDNKERLSWDVEVNVAHMLGIAVYAVAALAPLVGPGVFAEWLWRRPSYTLDVDRAFVGAAVAFWISAAFLVGLFVSWWRSGRCRNGVVIGFSVGYILCGLLTLVRAQNYVDEFAGDPQVHLAPVWLTIGLSVATILYQGLSPTNPQKNRIGTSKLDDASRTLLLSEREAALRTLSERDLLREGDVAALSAVPLGELHRPKEAQGER